MEQEKLTHKQLFAEFLGTFGLGLVSLFIGAAMGGEKVSMYVAIFLSMAVMSIGNVSGAHLNPAVTISMFMAQKFSINKTVAYLISQFSGVILAFLFFHMAVSWGTLSNERFLTKFDLFSNNLSQTVKVFFFEMVGMAIFMFAIMKNLWCKISDHSAAVLVGISYFLVNILSFIAINLSDSQFAYNSPSPAFLNPALAIVSGQMNLGYIMGPIVGGLVAVYLYKYFHTDECEIERAKNLKHRKKA